MRSYLHAVVQNLVGKRVLVVGDLMLDNYCWGTVTRVSPEAPIPVVHKYSESFSLGGAANTSANIANLGGQPLMVGVIGSDDYGKKLCEVLEETGIDSSHVMCDPSRSTTVKTRIIAHAQHVARVDQETVQPIHGSVVKSVVAAVESLVPSVDAVLISDYAKGVITDSVIKTVVARANAQGVPLVVDPKSVDFRRYNGCTVLTPNHLEARLAAGIRGTALNDIAEVGRYLYERLRVTALLITRGEHGMVLIAADKEAVNIPAESQDVYDVTGAGDTVSAVLSLALAAQAPIPVAAQLANIAAGVVVERMGTVAIAKGQLEEAIG